MSTYIYIYIYIYYSLKCIDYIIFYVPKYHIYSLMVHCKLCLIAYNEPKL